jgi:hypothetical protein
MFEQCPSFTTVNDYLHNSLCYCPSEPASVALWGDRATKFDADVVKRALLLSYFVL